MKMTSRSFVGCASKPEILYLTPCCWAGALKTLPKSKKLSRDQNLLGRRISLQQMYSGEWMGIPSAYLPGLSWGTRPTQLGVTASRPLGKALLSFCLLSTAAVAVGIVTPLGWPRWDSRQNPSTRRLSHNYLRLRRSVPRGLLVLNYQYSQSCNKKLLGNDGGPPRRLQPYDPSSRPPRVIDRATPKAFGAWPSRA